MTGSVWAELNINDNTETFLLAYAQHWHMSYHLDAEPHVYTGNTPALVEYQYLNNQNILYIPTL